MDIAKRKEEILHLIGQLRETRAHAGPGNDSMILADRPDRERFAPLGRLAVEPREVLLKRSVPVETPPSKVVEQLDAIDKRLERIERLLEAKSRPRGLHTLEPLSEPAPTSKRSPSAGAPAATPTLSGLVREGVLADVIQLINTNQMTGVMTVRSRNVSIKIFVRNGEIYSAVCGSTMGQDAFFAALAIGSGSFTFDETNDLPAEKTIDGNTQLLILEGLQHADEATVEEAPTEVGQER